MENGGVALGMLVRFPKVMKPMKRNPEEPGYNVLVPDMDSMDDISSVIALSSAIVCEMTWIDAGR